MKKPRTAGGAIHRRPSLEWEKKLGYPSHPLAGVDEVGRGCLAGPVVAGAVVLPDQIDFEQTPWLERITDSKKLTPEKREELAPLIEGWVKSWAIGQASVEEIDSINIFHASHLAMQRAVGGLIDSPFHVLVDGKYKPIFAHSGKVCASTAIIQGDLLCLSIAAASIVAKVWRDRLMTELDGRYPGYAFGIHKGYATPAHTEALKRLGACAIHRKSFAPVREVLQPNGFVLD